MVQFTPQEQKWIDHCFDATLFQFVKNPLTRDNLDHIRQAINYRNYHIGQIGVKNHALMHSIFDKMGYCRDGKTTKDNAMKKEIALEKEKAAIWTQQREEALAQIDAKIMELIQMKKDLQTHDDSFNLIVKEKAKVAEAAFKKDIKAERKESQTDLLTETLQTLGELNLRELREIAREQKITNYSRMRKADLVKAIGVK